MAENNNENNEKNENNENRCENETVKAAEATDQPVSESIIGGESQEGVRYYNSEKANHKKKLGKKGLIIFGCVVLGVIILGVSCSTMMKGITSSISGGSAVGEVEIPDSDYIATLYVEGTIMESSVNSYGIAEGYQHIWTMEQIDNLIEDSNNKGMILFIDSPGGSVYASDELYFKIKEYQEETGNPVYSAMGSMAASGGYYISAPCDKIIANRNCWTGSIGVTIGTLYDFSGLLDKFGVKTNTITSGANKAMGSSVEPMTEEQKAIFQALVDESYEQFVEVVADGRNMDIAKVKKIADGRIYTAKQAKENGLIDEIGTKEEAISDMKESYDLQDCEVADILYTSNSLWSTLFSTVDLPDLSAKGDVAAIMELMEDANEFPVSYMCEPLNSRK